MALHTQLPIYKVAYDLLNVSVDYVQNMPRPFKPVIGTRVSTLCMDLVILVIRANCASDKIPHLTTLLERVEEVNVWMRICKDKHFISVEQYAKAIGLTTSIGKQANGWKKHYAQSPVT